MFVFKKKTKKYKSENFYLFISVGCAFNIKHTFEERTIF